MNWSGVDSVWSMDSLASKRGVDPLSNLLQVCLSVVAEVDGGTCQPREDSPWAQTTASDGRDTPMGDNPPNQLLQLKEAQSRESR